MKMNEGDDNTKSQKYLLSNIDQREYLNMNMDESKAKAQTRSAKKKPQDERFAATLALGGRSS